jgi:hypothetical protein
MLGRDSIRHLAIVPTADQRHPDQANTLARRRRDAIDLSQPRLELSLKTRTRSLTENFGHALVPRLLQLGALSAPPILVNRHC